MSALGTFLTLSASIACLNILNAQPSRLTGRIDNNRRVVMAGRVHPQAKPQNDLGRVDTTYRMPTMALVLKPSDTQSLNQLLQEQQDPASPNFHKWLTPDQYADRFGASSGDVDQISEWLKSQGFQVAHVARSRTFITFDGSAGQAQNAFQTEIHRFRDKGETHIANASAPSIPTALSGMVASIRGLNDFRMQPRLRKALNPEMNGTGNTRRMAPDDFATIYNVAPLYTAGVDGTGQKIAVVGQTDIKTADISLFRSKFNLPAIDLQRVLVAGQRNPGVVSGDMEEADLDIEWASAVARNATIVYVYSNDVWQSAMYAVDQNLAPVLSMSYGLCEQADMVDLPLYQSVAQQANAQGITWLAAAGDAGASDCEDQDALTAQNGFAVDAPSTVPEVTAMGGTAIMDQSTAYWSATNTANGASALSYIPEQAWNDTGLGGGLSSTGGGRSIYFPRPAWQTGPGVPNDGVRHVPDLSVSSSANHVGYYVVSNSTVSYFGGTSVAAPTMAGIIALLNHYLVSTGAQKQPGLGNINPALYRLAQNTSGVFHDVTSGDNAQPCNSGSPDCTNGSLGRYAGAGYDEATGLGSVNAAELVHQWTNRPAITSAVVPSIDRTPVFQQSPDASGFQWKFNLTLTEEAGIGTTLTDFFMDGVSYASQIKTLFGTAAIPARGSISAGLGLKDLTVPKTVVFHFTGVDATGQTWATDYSVPFRGTQVPASVRGMSNAASGQQTYAPGMIVSIYGTELSSGILSATAVPLPGFLAGFQATVNGVTAPVYYVSPGQVNVQIPYETQSGAATLTLYTAYDTATYRFQVSAAAPGIFTFTDGSINPFRSASRGQTVTLFVTGEGAVTPSLPTGNSPSAKTPLAQLPRPRQTVSVTVGGVPSQTTFVGIPSGLVGVTQINYTIPDAVPLGVQPVVVTIGNVSSPPANITVQ